MATPDELIDVLHGLDGRLQADAVVIVERMQYPRLDQAPLHGGQQGRHEARELVGDLDMGRDQAPHPTEDEILIVAAQGGDCGCQRVNPATRQVRFEPLVEQLLNVLCAK